MTNSSRPQLVILKDDGQITAGTPDSSQVKTFGMLGVAGYFGFQSSNPLKNFGANASDNPLSYCFHYGGKLIGGFLTMVTYLVCDRFLPKKIVYCLDAYLALGSLLYLFQFDHNRCQKKWKKNM